MRGIDVTWVLGGAAVLVGLLLVRFAGMVRYIPNNRIGILEKVISLRGSLETGFIALEGETGFQPNVLRGGWHIFFPFQYRIHVSSLVTIPQGKIGYLFARDGKPLEPTQTLASNVNATDFQDTAAFLRAGGQRGPQRQILREGTYAINLVQWVVLTENQIYSLPLEKDEPVVFQQMAHIIAERGGFTPIVIKGADDVIGVVTVHDGPSLPEGEIIAPTCGENASDPRTYHNNFQDPEAFLRAGGRRGRQLQVLVDGTYYLNRLFATVETIKKTVIEVGSVGVVVSYYGQQGADLSGEDYKHGELVKQGQRGVWQTPLLPGKYAFNTYAGHVFVVPTTNIILKWIRNESGAHKFDENLAEVQLITKDAFSPSLPLSVVIHIDYKKAPLVIQRFGDIKRLVEQTLDPMVAAYFKNIGQTRTLIQLIQDRANIQTLAGDAMKEKFAHYNLELEEVLIGTPTAAEGGDSAIESILQQLQSRQIAEEQVETYGRQEKAAQKQRELREAEARAAAQQKLTESEVSIAVQSNQGKADYQRSVQQAAQIRALAEAEAEKAARIGIAQAIAIEEQVRAYGGPQFQVTQQVMSRFAEAIERAGVDVVPKFVVGGGQNGQTGSGLVESLMAMLLSDKLGAQAAATTGSQEMEALKKEMRQKLVGTMKSNGPVQKA